MDFTGISVTADAILSAKNTQEILDDIKLIGALLIAAEAVGTTSSCLNLIVEYLNTRKQFGKLIGSYQALKHPSVEILNKMEGARSQIYHAATLFEDSKGVVDRDVEVACRMAKASANDALLYAGIVRCNFTVVWGLPMNVMRSYIFDVRSGVSSSSVIRLITVND